MATPSASAAGAHCVPAQLSEVHEAQRSGSNGEWCAAPCSFATPRSRTVLPVLGCLIGVALTACLWRLDAHGWAELSRPTQWSDVHFTPLGVLRHVPAPCLAHSNSTCEATLRQRWPQAGSLPLASPRLSLLRSARTLPSHHCACVPSLPLAATRAHCLLQRTRALSHPHPPLTQAELSCQPLSRTVRHCE